MNPAFDRYCPRCDDRVPTVEPWRGWRWIWRAWVVGLVGVIAALPFIIWEPCLAPTLTVTYLSAAGVVYRCAKARPVCRICSLELDERPRGGTGVRVRPHRPERGRRRALRG
ncbi:MAG: hypothetical protein ACFCGT_21510 [Sandaracinaceae bacterium]